MSFSNNQRRTISICILLSGIILLTTFFINPPSNDYSIDSRLYQFNSRQNPNRTSSSSLPRVLCLILTAPKNFLSRVKAINDTWAPRCTGYYFVTEYDPEKLAEEQRQLARQVPIAPIRNITAGYDHLTQKSSLAFLFAYEKHYNDFDWFIKADDDTYLFVDHLQMFLREQNSSEPVTFGYNFKVMNDPHTWILGNYLRLILGHCRQRIPFRWCILCS